jgi:hypothetical protein
MQSKPVSVRNICVKISEFFLFCGFSAALTPGYLYKTQADCPSAPIHARKPRGLDA